VHAVLHGRTRAGRFHVHGFLEEGTTTTPFDMVVLNEMSRYHLVIDALQRSKYAKAPPIIAYCQSMLKKHHDYTRAHFEDLPEIQDWKWSDK
jgi:xylulose-5-phosphate/fructose-6-phosphate phosphoketolase